MSLASIAYEEGKWTDVVDLTNHILDLDLLNHVSGYLLDLDPFNYTEAYFYNAVANFKLTKFEDAEKSGLKAERTDLPTHFPQLHLLLAEIFARKQEYAIAISQIQMYLELAPHAGNADQVRQRLAQLEKLNGAVSASENIDPK